jgi:hypothetical protein
MDTRTLGAVLLKVAGLVLLLYSISQLPGYFALTGREYGFSISQSLATAAIALGPLALLGLILWFFPRTLVNKIVSPSASDDVARDGRSLELVALTLVGVYLVAHGLIGAVRDAVLLIVVHRENEVVAVPASVIAHIGATIAELLIGAGLCIGAKGVSRVIERLRQ